MRELQGYDFPRIDIKHGQELCKNFKQLVKRIRNVVAHCNLEFFSSGGEIDRLTIWNNDENDGGKKVWVAYLTLDNLHEITEVLLDTLEEQFKASSKSSA